MTRIRSNAGRIATFGLVLAVLVGVFAVRLIDIQVVRAAELNEKSNSIRSDVRPLYGTRGEIVAADGTALAKSVIRWDIAISPKDATSDDREIDDPDRPGEKLRVVVPPNEVLAERRPLFDRLGEALGIRGSEVVKTITRALEDNPDSEFAYLAKLVDNDVRQRVADLDLPWVVPYQHPSRIYPDGSVAGNLLGFTDIDGVPLAGLEAAYDDCLTSVDGREFYLRSRSDWVEIPGSTKTLEPSRDGGTLHTTIDEDLQFYAQSVALDQVRKTGAKWATVVVSEVETGRLLAVVDVPTLDPNTPAEADPNDRGARSFTAPFEPGSTFKAVTAASLLDAGLATPTEPGVVAPYRWVEDGINLADSDWHEDQNLTLTGVLIQSSNTGMLQFGSRLSDEQRYDYDTRFGFGATTEVGFLGEEDGDISGVSPAPDLQTKYATMFGQGLTVTAVQLASAYGTIANGGVRMPVTLVDGCEHADGSVTEQPKTAGTRAISADAAEQTTAMLEQVYRNSWVAEDWNIPGYRVAAKTGTAQVPDLVNGGYQDGYLVSVAGFAPADAPKYVVSVSLMDPVKMNTSAAAAPVFQQVMSQVLKSNRVVPSGTSAPELPATW